LIELQGGQICLRVRQAKAQASSSHFQVGNLDLIYGVREGSRIEDEKSIIDAISVAFEFRWPEVILVTSATVREVSSRKEGTPGCCHPGHQSARHSGFDVLKGILASSPPSL